jgi:arsenite-transporting ATPase
MDDGLVMMFGGKGGVGKTTCAAATALHFARTGQRTLAITTDATPSLSHIFETDGRNRIAQVTEHLSFSELGQEVVREMWDKKFGHEVHEVFSSFVSIRYDEFTEFMTSVLPGLADEFMVDYTRELVGRQEFDVVVWDTAPMGQTLALLKTPELLSKHLRMAPRIYSRLRVGETSKEPVLSILRRWQNLSASNMDFLRTQVKVTLVTIAEALAVEQLDGILSELHRGGIEARHLIVNHLVKDHGSEFLRTRAAGQRKYLDVIYQKCSRLRITELPLSPVEVKGIAKLEEVASILFPTVGD